MTASRPEPPLSPADWLQCEALRRLEEREGRPSLDDPATRRATRTDGTLVERIAVRARLHVEGKRLAASVGRALAGVGWTLALLTLLGGLLGALAARAQLDNGVVQLSWALLTLLGLPTLLLALWLVVWAWPKRAARGLPGRALWAAIAGLARRFDSSGHGRAIGAALADYGRAGGARIASAATHLFWAGYLAGAIALLAAAFVGLRFDFAWGSTLLGTETLAPVVDGLGRIAALWPGITAPDDAAIRALLIDRSPPADRGAWAGVLLAVLALGGLLPRLLLAAGFLVAHRRQRLALDLSRPGYVALAGVLRPDDGGSTGRVGPKPPARLSQRTLPRASPGNGPRVAVGLELNTDHAAQSELVPDAEWLGAADDRRARRTLLEAIGTRRPRPEAVVVLCSMARTPDRGAGAWLAELDAISPVAIRLVEAREARERGDDLDARAADWARLADDYGLDAPERDD
ncbi:DUF2868 domain-containing protein [Halomonas denitrificans]|nr:DUF2868 domain-containing protein [Halomonas denitrificans]